jgi:ankyrin repeat protein
MKLNSFDSKKEREKQRLGKELVNACYFGNVNQSLELIKKGAQLDYVSNTDDWMAIHYAARWGLMKTLEEFVRHGIDINVRTRDGRETALHKACRTNRKNVCIFLLQNGANPNLLNSEKQRASELCNRGELCYIVDNFDEYLQSKLNY